MKPSTAKHLEYFVGRVCTIFIGGNLNRSFNEQQFADYFVGVVDAVSQDGIFTTHPVTGGKNYYAFSSVVAICEEQVLDPEKPEEAELIRELQENGVQPNMQLKSTTESPYADIDVMTDLARQAKEIEEKRKK